MEGNVVFRQGEAVIHADRMYYDVARRSGVVLQAELLTPVPDYEGVLRLRTEILQQLGPNRFLAQNAFLTASRMGRPGYRIQVESATPRGHRHWPRSIRPPDCLGSTKRPARWSWTTTTS